MARKLRLQYEGAIYHVTVRGNGRRAIFKDFRDRERLLERLAESCETYVHRRITLIECELQTAKKAGT